MYKKSQKAGASEAERLLNLLRSPENPPRDALEHCSAREIDRLSSGEVEKRLRELSLNPSQLVRKVKSRVGAEPRRTMSPAQILATLLDHSNIECLPPEELEIVPSDRVRTRVNELGINPHPLKRRVKQLVDEWSLNALSSAETSHTVDQVVVSCTRHQDSMSIVSSVEPALLTQRRAELGGNGAGMLLYSVYLASRAPNCLSDNTRGAGSRIEEPMREVASAISLPRAPASSTHFDIEPDIAMICLPYDDVQIVLLVRPKLENLYEVSTVLGNSDGDALIGNATVEVEQSWGKWWPRTMHRPGYIYLGSFHEGDVLLRLSSEDFSSKELHLHLEGTSGEEPGP